MYVVFSFQHFIEAQLGKWRFEVTSIHTSIEVAYGALFLTF